MNEDTEQRQWDGDDAPDGLAFALGNNSLGNAAVVAELVGRFVSDIHALCGRVVAGSLGKDDLDAEMRAESMRLADIFSGRAPGYHLTSWLTARMGGLKTRARGYVAAMQAQGGEDFDVDGDPVAGLFYVLANESAGAYVAAHNGETEHTLPQVMQRTIGMLLGYPEDRA